MFSQQSLDDTILVSGFAQTPKGIPAHHSYKYIGAILLVDKNSHTIEQVDFSIIFSDLTKQILRQHIEGFCVNESFHEFANQIKNHVSIPSIGAVLQAVRAAIDRYYEHIKK
ncbi:DUF3870 domain-containing protein [Salibacterium aidingense]|uniref:DUF3870 domain-containing protein n=1 Tax=Salibacterium aidingense TaxID=384933 RepID=UPI0003F50C79|nr:DUF3870 domain-containing protein [Salibacterium aidingense]